MRLWSIHPTYLDTAGLTACWREGLLARKVLMGQTRGYRNHPQLLRFKESPDPVRYIDVYLGTILDESLLRGYNFDASKIARTEVTDKITVTKGQMEYEFEHLKRKLANRNPEAYKKIADITTIEANPIFRVIDGGVEKWEIR